MTVNTVDLQRVWTAKYLCSRYLREKSPTALAQRYDNLIQNLWSTDREGRIAKGRNQTHHKAILQLLFDVNCEKIERDTKLTDVQFDERAMINEAAAQYKPPVLKPPIVDGIEGFAKFGKRNHIRASFERGIFRIAPASSYDDPSLNGAQADKELEHITVTPNESLRFRLHGTDVDGNEIKIEPKPIELFRYMNVPDFYVWCCGNDCDLRMLHDFRADALLLIKDRASFTNRLLEAVEKINPGFVATHGPVSYYDPYEPRSKLTPIFSKNFKYLYQNEYRFAWRRPSSEVLSPFLVELGPLDDIAQYYETA